MTDLNELTEARLRADTAMLTLASARDTARAAQDLVAQAEATLKAAAKSYGSLRSAFIQSVLLAGPATRADFRAKSGGLLVDVELEIGLVVLEDDNTIERTGSKWQLVTPPPLDSPTCGDEALAAR